MSTSKKNYKKIFISIAESKGYKVHQSNGLDKKNNVDFILEGQSGGVKSSVKIDIKKKNGKNSNQWIYIEYANSKGGKGWLYGLSDFIVFETGTSFIFVPRKGLLNFLNSNNLVRWDLPYVDKPWLSKYRLLRREGTLETISQIKVKDILNITNTKTWDKP